MNRFEEVASLANHAQTASDWLLLVFTIGRPLRPVSKRLRRFAHRIEDALMTKWLSWFGLLFGVCSWNAAACAADAEKLDFGRDVRRILSDNCFKCHGPDVKQLQAGLRLDQREVATAKLESGKVAIVAGNSAESEV